MQRLTREQFVELADFLAEQNDPAPDLSELYERVKQEARLEWQRERRFLMFCLCVMIAACLWLSSLTLMLSPS